MYELWQWNRVNDGERWVMVAIYKTLEKAKAAGKATCDPPDTWTVAKSGSQKADHMRANAADRLAPTT
jgi:hypothetical protein